VNNIITAADVQQGDRIKVTLPAEVDNDRKYTRVYEGVAHSNGAGAWRTENRWNLYAHEDGAVIELLERPEPPLLVPTGTNAIVQYDVSSFDPGNPKRTAIRDAEGKWTAYDSEGDQMDTHYGDEEFSRFLKTGEHTNEVVFGGTK
jgi:hypothetical protein